MVWQPLGKWKGAADHGSCIARPHTAQIRRGRPVIGILSEIGNGHLRETAQKPDDCSRGVSARVWRLVACSPLPP